MSEPPKGFVPLSSLRGPSARSAADVVAEIRKIYFKTTAQTIQHDLAHAIELLKLLPDEESRDRAAVYMDGLSQMRSDWARTRKRHPPKRPPRKK